MRKQSFRVGHLAVTIGAMAVNKLINLAEDSAWIAADRQLSVLAEETKTHLLRFCWLSVGKVNLAADSICQPCVCSDTYAPMPLASNPDRCALNSFLTSISRSDAEERCENCDL
jgi:hypothetical protein